MTLKLPDVMLICIETRQHDLARLAVKDCTDKAEFAEVLICTDKPERFDSNARLHVVEDWPQKVGWSRFFWFGVTPLIRTSHVLSIQWDSWIVDASQWRDDFLAYDYIGAPWWYRDGKNVGNGGFSITSTALRRYVRDRRALYPVDTDLDDDLFCRKYRAALEEVGFRWAPEPLAHQFAFECCRPSPSSRHFGFHAAFNFPDVLSGDRLRERMRLMFESPTLRESKQMQALCQRHPNIIKSLMMDEELAQAAE